MCGTLKEKLNAMSKVMRVTNNNSVGEYCAIVELVRDAHVRNLFFFFRTFFLRDTSTPSNVISCFSIHVFAPEQGGSGRRRG